MTTMALAFVKAGLELPPDPQEEQSPSYCIVCLGDCTFPNKYCCDGCRWLDQFGIFEEELPIAYGCIRVPRRRER